MRDAVKRVLSGLAELLKRPGVTSRQLAEGHSLTEELQNRIKNILRQNASPGHVPAKIIQVPEIPYTFFTPVFF